MLFTIAFLVLTLPNSSNKLTIGCSIRERKYSLTAHNWSDVIHFLNYNFYHQ